MGQAVPNYIHEEQREGKGEMGTEWGAPGCDLGPLQVRTEAREEGVLPQEPYFCRPDTGTVTTVGKERRGWRQETPAKWADLTWRSPEWWAGPGDNAGGPGTGQGWKERDRSVCVDKGLGRCWMGP